LVTREYGGRGFLAGLAKIGLASLIFLGVSGAVRGQEIRVKFLDARNGRPVTYEAAQTWVETLSWPSCWHQLTTKGNSHLRLYRPQHQGNLAHQGKEISLLSEGATIPPGPVRIAAAPTVAAGICWDLGPLREGPWYPISEILQHGAVSENRCGKATAKPKPGELILFIKPIPAWKRILGGFSE